MIKIKYVIKCLLSINLNLNNNLLEDDDDYYTTTTTTNTLAYKDQYPLS